MGARKRQSRSIRGPKAVTKVVVIPDTHIPFHDVLAWDTALEVVRVVRPDVLIFLGDVADCYEISTFPKTPGRKHNFASEMAAVNTELDRVDRLRVPDVRFLLGNHEDRLDRLLASQAPELHGFVSMDQILGLTRRGYQVIPYGETTSTGKIMYAHDFGRCGKNAAEQSLRDAGHNVVFGHTHQAQCQYGGLITGERHVGWAMGWLGDYESLAFSYRRKWKARREWTHGVGSVTLDEAGNGWVQFHPIIGGRCIVNGKVIYGQRAAA